MHVGLCVKGLNCLEWDFIHPKRPTEFWEENNAGRATRSRLVLSSEPAALLTTDCFYECYVSGRAFENLPWTLWLSLTSDVSVPSLQTWNLHVSVLLLQAECFKKYIWSLQPKRRFHIWQRNQKAEVLENVKNKVVLCGPAAVRGQRLCAGSCFLSWVLMDG